MSQLRSDREERLSVDGVPAVGIDQLHAGDPPGRAKMVIALGGNGARDFARVGL
jgi:hypothetical protein